MVPKTPPPATTAKHTYTRGVSWPLVYVKANDSATGMQIAKIPHDVPVANAIIVATTKIMNGNKLGDMNCLTSETM